MSRETAGGVTAGLRDLLGRMQAFRVDWSKTGGAPQDTMEYEPGIDREEADLDKANVVSSILKPSNFLVQPQPVQGPRHVVALDIDVPAHLVSSSTPGHSHLYIEVPGGVPHHRYMALLHALADAGVIEPGYAQVSIARGHSDLRLPWVAKGDELPAKPDLEFTVPGAATAVGAPELEPTPQPTNGTSQDPWARPIF